MTPTKQNPAISVPTIITTIVSSIALATILLTGTGFVRKSEIDEMRSKRDVEIADIRSKHEADVTRIERKLDCALWDIPHDCKKTMAPHDAGQ